MGSLQNTKGFAAVRKQVAAFSGKAGGPSAPTSKTAELRCVCCVYCVCVRVFVVCAIYCCYVCRNTADYTRSLLRYTSNYDISCVFRVRAL